MKPLKITSIGEILFDIYPEQKKLGGAPFNFIYHVWKLTGNGNFISKVGSDDMGNELLSFLNNISFNTTYIQIDKIYPTGTVQVELNDKKTPSFEIKSDAAYDKIELDKNIKQVFNNQTDLLYFGTLAQRDKTSQDTIQSLWGKDKTYFCDINLRKDCYTEKIIRDSLMNSDIVKLNTSELFIIANAENITGKDKIDTAKQLLYKYNLELLSITQGEEGALLVGTDNYSQHKSTPEIITDTLGAGDAYAAMLCISYLLGWDLKQMNEAATEFAADICTVNGALPQDDKIYNKYKKKIHHENQ